MRLIDADALMEKLNGIWDCNDMTFAPVDGCCIDADCKSCRWRETIEYVKRLVQNQTTISELIDRQTAMFEIAKLKKIVPYYFHGEKYSEEVYFNAGLHAAMGIVQSQPTA